MISFNFDYYIPQSIGEAVKSFEELKSRKKKPLYYSGGTEIITFARKNDVYTEAVIDLKSIPECNTFYTYGNKIIIGSAVTLTTVQEAKFFPLLTENSAFPADHTSRNKITFGGNICGRIIFKESVLTPLITDAQVIIAGKYGIRSVPIINVFNQKLQLQEGEFLVQIIIDKSYGELPYFVKKRTKYSKIGYPILSMAAVKRDGKMLFALSGICNFPFRSLEMEEVLNDTMLTPEQSVEEAMKRLPAPIVSNVQSGREYREFVLKNTLVESMITLGVK